MLIVKATYTRPTTDVAFIQDVAGANEVWKAYLQTFIDAGQMVYPPDRRIQSPDNLQMTIISHWVSAAANQVFLDGETSSQNKVPHNTYNKEHGITFSVVRELVYDENDVAP